MLSGTIPTSRGYGELALYKLHGEGLKGESWQRSWLDKKASTTCKFQTKKVTLVKWQMRITKLAVLRAHQRKIHMGVIILEPYS